MAEIGNVLHVLQRRRVRADYCMGGDVNAAEARHSLSLASRLLDELLPAPPP